MREITTHQIGVGLDQHLRIEIADDPDTQTGVSSKYNIFVRSPDNKEWTVGPSIKFQKGTVIRRDSNTGKEIGIDVNGISLEVLLAVAIDQLQQFQNERFKCRENAIALTHLEDAMHWLQHRTRDRAKRGVEGSYSP